MSAASWQEAKKVVADTVKLPQGSYIEWSGQYENEVRARQRLQIVIPVVLAVIYLLLYLTYHSLLEAAHVLLAVPFALSGGIYLLYVMGYNMSVAVMVGFIALFGTAVQTAVVMVIYLEEAVVRKRQELGGHLTREILLEAVTEGALLRLRPKVMTVSTVVASLLPIMWSHSTGAEVMKPLATPVLGGMVSSLVHVLLVTPVIFYWLRERELRRADGEGGRRDRPRSPRAADPRVGRCTQCPNHREEKQLMQRVIMRAVLGVVLLTGLPVALVWGAELKAIQTQKAKDMTITLLSESGQWTQGKNTFVLEFTSAATRQPVDVGKVTLSTSMPMPGMAPMLAGATLSPDKAPGRYLGTISFPDRGARQVTVAWDGPTGKGSTQFSVPVR